MLDQFVIFKEKLQKHFNKMSANADKLFEVDVDKELLWDTYLDSFAPGTNNIFRERREHDCTCCRQFIRTIGAVVVIKDNKMESIWDVDMSGTIYEPVVKALSKLIHNEEVVDVFVSQLKNIGTDKNFEMINGKSHQWDHFYMRLPDKFVFDSRRSAGNIHGEYRDIRNVFKRSLDEITIDSVETVLELINSNTLYRGTEWKVPLVEFKKYKTEYDKLPEEEKDLYVWEKSLKAGAVIGKIRNHSIGTLLVNVSEGMDLDTAVKKYEQIVAPSNYKRSKPIYTQRMLDDAKKTLTELGYMDSLKRRFANMDDITVNNILFSNKDAAKRISGGGDIFTEMSKSVAVNPKKFSRVEEVTAQDFVEKVLPTAKEVEVFVENKHEKNFVSLIAPENSNANTMFKWNNGLSWAYTGNITDSDIRQNVKNAGGNVDGVLRFSIMWNEDQNDNSDLDAHCIEPNGHEIYFGSDRKPRKSKLGGQLDIDVIEPYSSMPGKPAVENITWQDKSRMIPGAYRFFVNQYTNRGSKGFKAEIEFDGEIYSFEYNNPVRGDVDVAEVIMDKNGNFTIKEKLFGHSVTSSREVWGVKTNQFTPVSVISYSPNYFDEQNGIGNKHLFFFLNGCVNPEQPNGFFVEYLKNELVPHRKVFEALGAKCSVTDVDDQLSGVGFSLTQRNELIVKVKGATERIIKIKF